MAGLMLASRQVKQPYYISELNKNIYSVEELGYFLYNYMYLVDEQFFCEALINYIENVLGNAIIAQGIKQARAHNGKLTDTIAFVVKASGYYSQKEMDKFSKQLELLGTKTNTERVKAKADILMETGKYNMAQVYYSRIIRKGINSDLPMSFYGAVYHNIGVTYVKMFAFGQAAAYFRKAYDTYKNEDSLKSLLLADVMDNNDKKLERDMEKYNVGQDVLDDYLSDVELIKAEVGEVSEKEDEIQKFLQNCRQEYVKKLNSCAD